MRDCFGWRGSGLTSSEHRGIPPLSHPHPRHPAHGGAPALKEAAKVSFPEAPRQPGTAQGERRQNGCSSLGLRAGRRHRSPAASTEPSRPPPRGPSPESSCGPLVETARSSFCAACAMAEPEGGAEGQSPPCAEPESGHAPRSPPRPSRGEPRACALRRKRPDREPAWASRRATRLPRRLADADMKRRPGRASGMGAVGLLLFLPSEAGQARPASWFPKMPVWPPRGWHRSLFWVRIITVAPACLL